MASSLPKTLGELQLYRILQRANLLSYFDAFIQQGGDDVQQLCEAGEEEFLEIMALVGMASKPLHVRRLQKALRDWVTNPGVFNQPLTSLPVSSIPIYKLPESSSSLLGLSSSSYERNSTAREPHLKIPKCAAATCVQSAGKSDGAGNSPLQFSSEGRHWPSHHTTDSEHSLSPADLGSPASPRDTSETLDAAAALSVAECVERMLLSLPKSDLGEVREMLKNNKKLAKMIGHIFEMADKDPRKEEEIRKYSAIYGRFDSKRKDGNHLTLHELTVNEAAAQLCMKDIALLTRRDELFTLARQISREVTYKYSYRTTNSRSRCEDRDELLPKRIKVEDGFADYQEILLVLHQQLESLKEQLAVAKASGEESSVQSLQVEIEKVVAKQMEIFRNSGYEVLHSPQKGHIKQNAEESDPTAMASDSSNGQGEKALNLRMSHDQCRPQHMASDGEQTMGKPTSNEFGGLYSSSETSAPASADSPMMLKDYSQAAVSNTERRIVKLEPEDKR